MTRLGDTIELGCRDWAIETPRYQQVPPVLLRPFHHPSRTAGGTGMGLAIVRAVMESHRGTITLAPDISGTTFDLEFPVS